MRPFLALGVAFFAAAPCLAQSVSPSEDQFQVNTFTTDEQSNPTVAMDESGAYIVVWTTEQSPGPDNSASSVWAQRFGPDSTPIGNEFQVNTYAPGFQMTPDVAMRPTGEFVVVWGSSTSGGSDTFYSVQGQRFAADGTPVDGEFQVNTLGANVQESPSVAMTGTGEFLVVWQSIGSPGPDNDGRSIQAQLFANDGTPAGNQFQVNTYQGSDQADPEVATGPTGEYIVSWFNISGSGGSDNSGRSIQAQQISSTGQLLGGEFQVNSYIQSNQYNPSVAAGPDGEFVVVWSGNGSFGDDAGYAVLGQRYDSDGLAIGTEFQVNTYIDSVQSMPSVAATNDGSFLVTWRSGDYSGTGPDGDGYAIAGQAFASDGTFSGDEFVVNDLAQGQQSSPDVSAAPAQHYAAAWQSDSSKGTDLDLSIQARRFEGADNIFADGFESGDTTAWTVDP